MTYYETVRYDIQDIINTYMRNLSDKMYEAQPNPGVIEVEHPDVPGLFVYAPATPGGVKKITPETERLFEEELETAARLADRDKDAIRTIFANGEILMLLPDKPYIDIIESIENDLVEKLEILDGDDVLVSMESDEWSTELS